MPAGEGVQMDSDRLEIELFNLYYFSSDVIPKTKLADIY